MPGDNMLQTEIEDRLRLRLLQVQDSCDEFAIDKETPFAGDRMNTNHRVDSGNRVFSDQSASRSDVVDHFCRGVHRLELI